MSKKLNSVIFTVVATLVNIILIVGFMVLGFFIVGSDRTGSGTEESFFWIYAIVIVAIILGWLCYQGLLNLFLKHHNPDQMFERIFKHREKHADKKSN